MRLESRNRVYIILQHEKNLILYGRELINYGWMAQILQLLVFFEKYVLILLATPFPLLGECTFLIDAPFSKLDSYHSYAWDY